MLPSHRSSWPVRILASSVAFKAFYPSLLYTYECQFEHFSGLPYLALRLGCTRLQHNEDQRACNCLPIVLFERIHRGRSVSIECRR